MELLKEDVLSIENIEQLGIVDIFKYEYLVKLEMVVIDFNFDFAPDLNYLIAYNWLTIASVIVEHKSYVDLKEVDPLGTLGYRWI